MSWPIPFTPKDGGTVSISVTTSSAATTFTAGSNILLLTNAGADACFVKLGTSAPTATVADLPILANSAQTISIPATFSNIAAITASGTATLYITPGQGV